MTTLTSTARRAAYFGGGSTSTRLHRNPVSGGLRGATVPAHDVPRGGMLLSTTPLVPAACDAFTPAELAARIARYQRLAEAGRPLLPTTPLPRVRPLADLVGTEHAAPPDRLVCAAEGAELLGVSIGQICAWALRGLVRSRGMAPARDYHLRRRYSLAELHAAQAADAAMWAEREKGGGS